MFWLFARFFSALISGDLKLKEKKIYFLIDLCFWKDTNHKIILPTDKFSFLVSVYNMSLSLMALNFYGNRISSKLQRPDFIHTMSSFSLKRIFLQVKCKACSGRVKKKSWIFHSGELSKKKISTLSPRIIRK